MHNFLKILITKFYFCFDELTLLLVLMYKPF